MLIVEKNKKRWMRNELLLAMSLYCELPFGRLHARAPEIIELAKILGRTPSSVAMKLCNFASLDPIQQARGVKGLKSASEADREIWKEFQADWEKLGIESERLRQDVWEMPSSKLPTQSSNQIPNISSQDTQSQVPHPTGPTESNRLVKVRLAQAFFRRTVLASYGTRCCITGIPLPELLIASHILPWGRYPEYRINPHNGLCLSRLHDGAFDRGLITFDEKNRLVLSKHLKDFLPDKALEMNFVQYEGIPIRLPEKFLPQPHFLKKHREEIFFG